MSGSNKYSESDGVNGLFSKMGQFLEELRHLNDRMQVGEEHSGQKNRQCKGPEAENMAEKDSFLKSVSP